VVLCDNDIGLVTEVLECLADVIAGLEQLAREFVELAAKL
jgi:hypothetical protein